MISNAVTHLLPDGSTCFPRTPRPAHCKPVGDSSVCPFIVPPHINEQPHIFPTNAGLFSSHSPFPTCTFPFLLLGTLLWMSARMYVLSTTDPHYLMLLAENCEKSICFRLGRCEFRPSIQLYKLLKAPHMQALISSTNLTYSFWKVSYMICL